MGEFSGFYKMPIDERVKLIKEKRGLSDDEVEVLKNTGALSLDLADRMIENVIGGIHLPMGLGMNFKINGKEILIPMAVEEPSIIAGASKAAKLTLPEGFKGDADEPVMIGQMLITDLENYEKAESEIEKRKSELIGAAREHAQMIEKYGGGMRDIRAKTIDTKRGKMLVVEFDIDVRDSMGANTVNTILEATTPKVIEIVGGIPRARIISNLATKRKVRVSGVWKKGIIGEENIEGMLDMYEFAQADPYRCSTHNKGIMNGIDAVVLATGNDWRAVEAGAHSYASLDGYHSLTKWEKTDDGDLKGTIELPMAVATVGGAVNTKPTAKIALKIMDVKTSKELSMAMAAAGLANNFAALYAISTEGIQKGHMKLHARNIAVMAGASNPDEIDKVASALAEKKDFRLDAAKKILAEIRG